MLSMCPSHATLRVRSGFGCTYAVHLPGSARPLRAARRPSDDDGARQSRRWQVPCCLSAFAGADGLRKTAPAYDGREHVRRLWTSLAPARPIRSLSFPIHGRHSVVGVVAPTPLTRSGPGLVEPDDVSMVVRKDDLSSVWPSPLQALPRRSL
uniref:Uncharacterized protein n=1 Tax=Mycena chlorophos TaxID=658473 RepID=A0ABQ0LG72_MYCCL|nr:predicted protein [Mycena chlorophos]